MHTYSFLGIDEMIAPALDHIQVLVLVKARLGQPGRFLPFVVVLQVAARVHH